MSFWKRYYPVYALVFAAVITLTLLADHAVDLAVQTAAASSDADPVVLIDPGHGGEDGGACTNDGVREADLNLEISGVLADLCRVTGFPYRMIRTEDKAVYSPQAGTISEKKISDLKNRAGMINETPGAILVSIHQNMFRQDKYWGTQVFYAPTSGSMELAELIQSTVREQLQQENSRNIKPANAVYLMQHIQAPGVLVECGFLSNPQEKELLQQTDYQKKIAGVILDSLNAFYKLKIDEA